MQSNKNARNKSVISAPRIRRRSLAIEVATTLGSAAPRGGFLFEALEPRILLSADGILPLPLDVGLLDTISDTDPGAGEIGQLPEALEAEIPAVESGSIVPGGSAIPDTESAEENTAVSASADAVSGADTAVDTNNEDESADSAEFDVSAAESESVETDAPTEELTEEAEATSEEAESAITPEAVSKPLTSLVDETGLTEEQAATEMVEQLPFPAVEPESPLETAGPKLQVVFVDVAIEGYENLIDEINSSDADVSYANFSGEAQSSFDSIGGDNDSQISSATANDGQSKNADPEVDLEISGLVDDGQAINPSSDPADSDTATEVDSGIVVYLIDSSEDGVSQITQALARHADVDAVHILSHGAAGTLNLGNARLNNDTLDRYALDLARWGDSLAEGADVLLYGCDVASNAEGAAFVDNVADHIGANVAASNDDTGNVADGGDFDLEYLTGNTSSVVLFGNGVVPGFSGVLMPMQLEFVMATGENAVTVSFDGTNIIVTDGTNTTTELFGDVLDILVTGVDNEDDTLTVDFANEFFLDIAFDGGLAGNDSLVINSGNFSSVTYVATGTDSGDITIVNDGPGAESSIISFSGLEPVIDNSDAADRTFVGTAGADNIQLTDADAGNSGQSIIQDAVNGAFESITFNNPTNSLTIQGGDGDDVIDITTTQDPGLAPTVGINVEGGVGSDILTLDLGSSLPINLSFDGGVGDIDRIEFSNGVFTTVSHNATADGEGSVVFAGGNASSISYSELEEINDQSTADNRVFDGTGGDDTITLSDTGTASDGLSLIEANADITFANPTDSLLIQGGAGDDTITATGAQDNGLAPTAGFTIDGGGDDDTVDLDGNENYLTTILNTETLTVDGSDESEISLTETLAGLQALADFAERLEGFGQFDAELPLTDDITVGDISGLSETLQRLRDDLGSDENFDGDATGEASRANLEAFLAAWAPSITAAPGNVTVSTSGVTPTVVEVQNGNTLISRSVTLQAERTATLDIENTDELVEANILLVGNTPTYQADVVTDLTFTIGNNVTSGGFVTQIGNLAVAAAGNTIDLSGDVTIGVLGATIDTGVDAPDLDLDLTIGVTFDDPNGDGTAVSIAELNAANGAGAAANAAADALVDITGSGEFSASINFTPDDGFAPSLAGTIEVGGSNYELFTDYTFGAPINLGSADLYGISLLSANDLVKPLTDFANWLERLTESGLYDGNVPLVDGIRPGDLLDGDGLLRDEIIDVITNATGIPLFDTVQSLNDLLAADPSQLVIDYDAGSTSLGFTLSLQDAATSTAAFDYNLVLDALTALDSSVDVTIETSYGLDAVVRFDLAPVDNPSLQPGGASENAQTGQITDDLGFTLTVGTVTQTVDLAATATADNNSLADFITDLNTAIQTAFGGGVVSVSLDTSLGADNPKLLLTPATVSDSVIISSLNNADARVLGLAQGEFDIQRNQSVNTLPDIDISGNADFAFTLEVNGSRSALLTVAAANTAGLSDAADLVPLFNTALAGLDVSATVENGRLVIAADDGANVTSLRILADSTNPISTVLGFDNAQISKAERLAPAWFDTAATRFDGTIRSSWSDTDANGQYGFVEVDFVDAAAQSTLTFSTELQDIVDNQVDLIQLGGSLGSVTNGPIASGFLSNNIGDPEYVSHDGLRGVVSDAGDVQFAVYLDGYVDGYALDGTSIDDDYRLFLSASQSFLPGDSTIGFDSESGSRVQELVSGSLDSLLLDNGTANGSGTLSGQATFSLIIDGSDTIAVTVDTTGNNSVIDLVDDINGAINSALLSAGLDYSVSARLLADVLVFRAADDLVLEFSNTNAVARNELQITDGASAERVVFSNLLGNGSILTEGRPRADVAFDIQIDGNAPVTISIPQSATANNAAVADLTDIAADVNAALLAAGITAAQVEARVIASRLALVNTGAADTQLRVNALRLETTVSGNSVNIFKSLSADIVGDALIRFADVLEQTDFEEDGTGSGEIAFLNREIPLINQAALELNDYIEGFGNFADAVNGLDVASIQDMERAINELTSANIAFTYGGTDNKFGIGLVYEQEAETEFGFFVDAYALGSLVADGPDLGTDPDIPLAINDDRVVIRDPLNVVELVAESLATIDINLEADLTATPTFSIVDGSRVDLDIRVDEDNLDFQAKVGSASLFVQDGSIVIDGDGDASTDDALNISTVFRAINLDGSEVLPGLTEDFEVDLTGAATVSIPLFANASVTSALPAASDPGSDGAPLIFELGDIADVIQELEGSVMMPDSDDIPDLVPFVESGLNALLSDPSLLIDGLDNMLSALQTSIEFQIGGLTQLPLIGDQLDDAVRPFLDIINQARIDLNDLLLNEYAEAVGSTGGTYDGDLTLILREALFDLFAGSGDLGVQPPGEADGNGDGNGPRLGLLQDLASDGNGDVGFEDILLTQFNDTDSGDEGIQYDFHLGQNYSIAVPFELGLGTNDLSLDSFLPGFDFNVGSDEGITIDVSWDLRIGFGISTQDLFYINTVHTEDISDTGSDYAEELILALDVSLPGFEADASLGLVGVSLTDGIDGPASITSLQQITLANSGIGEGSVDVNSAAFNGIEGGEFNLILHKDNYNSEGDFVSVDSSPEVFNYDLDDLTGTNFVTNSLSFIASLTLEHLTDILVTPDLSAIDFLNPGFGLTFTALDPDVTRIEFQHVDGNNFGFGSEVLDGGNNVIDVLSQFEDSRATGLGFANFQLASGGDIQAVFEAPVDGALNEDIMFTLMVAGQKVDVMVRASGLDEEVDNPDMDNDPLTDDASVGGLDAVAIQLQQAIGLALGEAMLDEDAIDVSLVETAAGSGQFVFNFSSTLPAQQLESIEWNTEETSKLSLKLAVDLFGDVNEDGDADEPDGPMTEDGELAPNVDRVRLTLPELVGSPSTSIYVTAEADAQVRLHVATDSDTINAGLVSNFGLPTIEFDLRAGMNGSVILFGQVDPEMAADNAVEFQIHDIDFDNIQLDLDQLLNTFLKPALNAIDTVLGPIFDIVGDGVNSSAGFLNAPIPLISDIASLLGQDSDISWLDLTGNKDSFNQFIGIVQQLSDLITQLPPVLVEIGNTGVINLGGWRIVLDDESPFYFPNTKAPVPIALVNAYDGASDSTISLLQILGITQDGSTIPEPGGFSLDLVAPSNIFKLLTGDTFDFFSFNLPSLEFELGIDFDFSFGDLGFAIAGGIGVTVDLGIGFDSTGLDRIRDARNAGAPIDEGAIIDGFFISTIPGGGPELRLDASFSGSGGVDIHTPSFCIDLGFLGSVCFPRFDIFVLDASINADFSIGLDLIDPNEDGKLRFDEIFDLTEGFSAPQNALYLFDVTAEASGSFDISGTILGVSLSTSDLGLGALGFSLDLSAQEIFGLLGIENPFNPIIAEYLYDGAAPTGVVRVNAGEFAYGRLYGDTNDYTGASVTVRSVGGNIHFTDNTNPDASKNTTVLSATGVDVIVFRGVGAGDYIDASGLTHNISLDIRGAGGNDTLIGGSGADNIQGDGGNDRLEGNGGDDALFGERGADTLFGGAGTDILSGGRGNDTLDGGSGGDQYVFLTTSDERSGFNKDIIIDSEVEAGFVAGRVIAIASVQRNDSNGILVTAEDHGLQTSNTISVSGVAGVATANGTVTVTRVTDDTFLINNRAFVGSFDDATGGGYFVDQNAGNLDPDRAPAFNLLSDTIDLRAANSSESLLFNMDASGTRVSFVDETVAVNTITHTGRGIETLLGGDGNDTYTISHNGNGNADHFTSLDGGEGADQYLITIGNLNGDINIQDSGERSAIDKLFVFGRDDVANPDTVGLTNQRILFDIGLPSENAIVYSPVGPNGPVDSGIEVIQVDLLQGDDVVRVESTPTESTVTINGGLGNDTFNIGVIAADGTEANLNAIDGTEENGTLKLFGNAEDPNQPDNAADLDQLRIFDTTDTVGNNAANGDAGLLNFSPDTGIGALTGLGITIGIDFGGMETAEITLGEGDDEFLMLGTIDGDRTSTGLTTLFGGTGADLIDLSLSNGGRIEVHGEEDNDLVTVLNSATADLFLFGDDGDDEINLTALNVLATATISGGLNNDTINIGSRRSSSDAGLGSVNDIDGVIAINGDDGLDTLIIDDSLDTLANSAANGDAGVLTDSAISGLGMENGIGNYQEFEQVYVFTGSGNDEFNVQSSDVDAITLIDTNGGDDAIVVSSSAPTVDGNLDTVQGDLVLHGGDGVNSLLISDVGTATADDNVVMDEGDFDPLRPFIRLGVNTLNAGAQNHHFITGLAGAATAGSPFTTGTIHYAADFNGASGDFHGQDQTIGGITVRAGNLGNTFQINSVYSNDLTTLHTGQGDDTVTTAALSSVTGVDNPTADGNLLVYGQQGDDIVDASLSDITVTLDGGDNDDILFGGNAVDLIVGGGDGDYLDGGDQNDVIYGDSEVTLTLDAELDTRVTVDSDGRDFLVGAGGQDQLFGEVGNDVVFGDNATATRDPVSGVILSIESSDPTGSEETLTSSGGTGAEDEIHGDQGDDILVGGAAADLIEGNDGADTIYGDDARILFSDLAGVSNPLRVESTHTGTGTDDTIFGDTAVTDPDDEAINALGGNDIVFGGDGDDTIEGQTGNDILFGDNGITVFDDGSASANDLLSTSEGDFGADTISGGSGDDVIIGDHADITRDSSNDIELIESTFTTGGDDVLSGDENDDIIIGGIGADEISGGSGNDTIVGDQGLVNPRSGLSNTIDPSLGGNDDIEAGSGNDQVLGGAGADNIDSGSGNDAVLGDNGRITGNGQTTTSTDFGIGGNDTIVTGAGNDQVIGGAGSDIIDSGSGNDAVLGDSGTTNGSTTSSLAPTVGGNDQITTGDGNDQVIGGVGTDNISTGTGNDAVLGDNGSTNGSTTTSSDPGVGGNDVIDSGSGNNQVIGGAGSDNINAGNGSDVIIGDSGQINGLNGGAMSTSVNVGGNDTINAGAGNNQVIGGAGADTINTLGGNDAVLGDNGQITGGGRSATSSAPGTGGNDRITTGGGNDLAIGGAGADNINTGSGNDALIGDNGTTNGSTTTSSSPTSGGNDTLIAGAGSDQIIGGAGADNIDAGSGNDAILGDNGTTNGSTTQSTEPGTGGDDTITASGGNNQVIGGAGGDDITTGGGSDSILGDNGQINGTTVTSGSPSTGGNDSIRSGGGADRVIGGAGSDTVNGGAGNDAILGDNGVLTTSSAQTSSPTIGGNDNLSGGSGDDAVFGGAGSDSVNGDAGDDRLLGDNGRFAGGRLETTDPSVGGNDSTSGGSGNDWALGGYGNDNIRGDAGNDVLLGDNGYVTPLGNDTYEASTTNPYIGGNDTISGGPGHDILIGGFGKDTLIGSLDEDVLIGDNGVVVFTGDGTILEVDAFGNGPLDRFVQFNLYGRDIERDNSGSKSVTSDIDIYPITDAYAMQDFALEGGPRLLHHAVPMAEADQADEADAVESEAETIEVGNGEQSLEVPAATGIESGNATGGDISELPAVNEAALLDVSEGDARYIGAASLAVHGWRRRTKRAGGNTKLAADTAAQPKERVFRQFRRAG